MRIACITRHSYPTAQEVRVTKFSQTLNTAGHEVYVFCPASEGQENSDTFEAGKIIRFVAPIRGFLGKLLFAPIPINPFWLWWLYRQFRTHDVDLVIVRDLRLALPVIMAAHVWGIKAILDLGEHYPGMMQILEKQNIFHHITRNRLLITWLEILSVRKADSVWVVVEENKRRLEQYNSAVEVVNNYPISIDGLAQKISVKPYSVDQAPIILTSFGVVDNIRGLDLAIDAVAILEREFENVELHIYGDGFFRDSLESQVKSLNLKGKVVFMGWISGDQKYDVMAKGDIGLILHKVCELTQHTVPNKIFDYMSVGLPVLSTMLRPVMRILEEHQCGVVAEDNAVDVASKLKALIQNQSLRSDLSSNGYNAVRQYFSWKTEEETMIRNIKKLTKKGN